MKSSTSLAIAVICFALGTIANSFEKRKLRNDVRYWMSATTNAQHYCDLAMKGWEGEQKLRKELVDTLLEVSTNKVGTNGIILYFQLEPLNAEEPVTVTNKVGQFEL